MSFISDRLAETVGDGPSSSSRPMLSQSRFGLTRQPCQLPIGALDLAPGRDPRKSASGNESAALQSSPNPHSMLYPCTEVGTTSLSGIIRPPLNSNHREVLAPKCRFCKHLGVRAGFGDSRPISLLGSARPARSQRAARSPCPRWTPPSSLYRMTRPAWFRATSGILRCIPARASGCRPLSVADLGHRPWGMEPNRKRWTGGVGAATASRPVPGRTPAPWWSAPPQSHCQFSSPAGTAGRRGGQEGRSGRRLPGVNILPLIFGCGARQV